MITSIHKYHSTFFYRILSAFIAFTFIFSVVLPPSAAAQVVLNLPAPGAMVTPSAAFTPALINGITIHPENPLEFDFIVGTGDDKLQGKAFEEESTKLIKYFLASLTVPEDEMWVNLSPYEKDRIVPEGFGATEMGRDLLAQDYILKQLTASLMYPEKELGSEFWRKIYQKAREQYGTTEIPVNTFNKVWIVPEKAVVYEHGQSAFVVKSRLKVMLESDYEAMGHKVTKSQGHQENVTGDVVTGDVVTTGIIREVIIPEIEREVNEGKGFANLRQIYNSAILAAWFKQNLKETLLEQVYVDKAKTKGVDVEDKTVNEKIYAQYLEAFKKGVYNYIKEDIDPVTQEIIPRKYFSGGANLTSLKTKDVLETYKKDQSSSPLQKQIINAFLAGQSSEQQEVNIKLLELSQETSAANVQRLIEESQQHISTPAEAEKAKEDVLAGIKEARRLLEGLSAKVEEGIVPSGINILKYTALLNALRAASLKDGGGKDAGVPAASLLNITERKNLGFRIQRMLETLNGNANTSKEDKQEITTALNSLQESLKKFKAFEDVIFQEANLDEQLKKVSRALNLPEVNVFYAMRNAVDKEKLADGLAGILGVTPEGGLRERMAAAGMIYSIGGKDVLWPYFMTASRLKKIASGIPAGVRGGVETIILDSVDVDNFIAGLAWDSKKSEEEIVRFLEEQKRLSSLAGRWRSFYAQASDEDALREALEKAQGIAGEFIKSHPTQNGEFVLAARVAPNGKSAVVTTAIQSPSGNNERASRILLLDLSKGAGGVLVLSDKNNGRYHSPLGRIAFFNEGKAVTAWNFSRQIKWDISDPENPRSIGWQEEETWAQEPSSSPVTDKSQGDVSGWVREWAEKKRHEDEKTWGELKHLFEGTLAGMHEEDVGHLKTILAGVDYPLEIALAHFEEDILRTKERTEWTHLIRGRFMQMPAVLSLLTGAGYFEARREAVASLQKDSMASHSPTSSPATARVEEIKGLLKEIDKELQAPDSGNLPEVAVLSDFHGGLNRFIMLLSDVLNNLAGFQGQLDPNRTIEEQLTAQGLSFKDIKGQIILGGDILDRGKHGIKIFLLIKELVEKGEGKIVSVTGNHDFWAFANLLGLHIPWYKGFHFYGDTEAENLIARYRQASPELFDTPESVSWWTQRLAEHNADQDAYQKKAFDGKVKEVRNRFIEDYKTFQKNWTDPQKDAMEKFIGYFARIGVTDPYVGLNGLGKTSALWWKQVLKQINQGYEARRSLGAEDAELSVWQEAIALAEKISRDADERLDQALREGKWWYRVFESINTHAYRSVEWSAKDWSSHKGWGDSVISEINEMIDAGLIHEEKLTQKNYIQSPTLQALARFYRGNFNLYAFTPYGDLFSHGGFPVSSGGTINIFYKGGTYQGKDIFSGLSAVSDDVKDTEKSLREIWEALHLVNTWYADMTTELKPAYIKRNIDQIGISKINKGIGVRHHVTGHNPIALGKLAGRPFMSGDSGYTHAFSDFGMSEKYGGQGGWVSMSAAGIKLRGFESETSDVLVENPRTHVWDKETGQIKKTIENLGLEGDVFLSGAKEQLSEELARLDASSPLMDLDTGAQLQTSLSSDLLGKLWSPSDTRRKHYQVAQDYKIVTEEGQLKLVNAVRWMMTKTPLSDVDGTLGLLDRIKELDALRQKEGEPRRTIRVLDWGSGEGVALIALKKWLNEAAIADVELIGYSNIYYLSWHNAPEGITFIFDVAENLINHLEGKKIDLIYSRFGMYHYTSEEIDRDAVVQHFRDLGGLLSSEGEIRSDFFYLLDSEVAAGGFDIMPITGKMGTKMRPIKDGVEDMEFTSDEIRDTSDSFTKGGIDLNPALLDLQIKRDGNGVPLPLPMQPIENMHIEGFLPVIINITPVTNLPLLLGLADTEQDMEETMPAMKAREPEEVSYLN